MTKNDKIKKIEDLLSGERDHQSSMDKDLDKLICLELKILQGLGSKYVINTWPIQPISDMTKDEIWFINHLKKVCNERPGTYLKTNNYSVSSKEHGVMYLPLVERIEGYRALFTDDQTALLNTK